MDKRVEGLLGDFPEIFEKRPPHIGELDDDWVIIEVPVDQSEGTESGRRADAIGISEDDFLSDLDRFGADFDDTVGQSPRTEESLSPANIPR